MDSTVRKLCFCNAGLGQMKGAYKSTRVTDTGQKANLITTKDVGKRGCPFCTVCWSEESWINLQV